MAPVVLNWVFLQPDCHGNHVLLAKTIFIIDIEHVHGELEAQLWRKVEHQAYNVNTVLQMEALWQIKLMHGLVQE
jgi:hypothetical protein